MNDNDRLYLTQYIEGNAIEEAREAARVKPFAGDITSYSGLLTIDKKNQSHVFFWYFPAENQPDEAPLILWLNGWLTPSTFGIFNQNGPFIYKDDMICLREESWQKTYNVVYFDNPIGVGFSHTNTEEGYSKSIQSVGINLYWALSQFLELFEELKDRQLYLAGLSFAGIYTMSLAEEIHKANTVRRNAIQLKGIFIGNPILDKSVQLFMSNYLFELGFLDINEKKYFSAIENKAKELMQSGRVKDAYALLSDLYYKDGKSHFYDITGLYDVFGFLTDSWEAASSAYLKFLSQDNVQKTLHVSGLNMTDDCSKVKENFFKGGEMSVTNKLTTLLAHYKVMIYIGQTDNCCSYAPIAKILANLDWEHKAAFNSSERKKLYEDGKVVGYQKKYGNLSEVLIQIAGHSVVSDKPKVTLRLLETFIKESS